MTLTLTLTTTLIEFFSVESKTGLDSCRRALILVYPLPLLAVLSFSPTTNANIEAFCVTV